MSFNLLKNLTKEYAKNHYTRYLKGKKVIIVGPDTNLIGRGLGKYIDSFDVVVRHNTVFEYFPFSSKLQKDFGSKTNVLYFAPQCFKDYGGKRETLKKLKELKNKNGLKFIVYQNGNRNGKYLTGPHCFEKQVNWFKKYAKSFGIETHYSDHVVRDLVKIMVNYNDGKDTIPRTGFISVVDMIVHQVGQLEIQGMSFYHGGGHAFRKKAMETLDPKLNAYGKDSGSHNSVIELGILRDLVKNSWIAYQFPEENNKNEENENEENEENENEENV